MIERLLFDRVDAKARRAPIGSEHHLIALPRAHEAQASLTFVQPATARTDVALDAAILQDVPIPPRFALDGLIHFALGLSFLNASEMVI
jgi:hypothetical protein